MGVSAKPNFRKYSQIISSEELTRAAEGLGGCIFIGTESSGTSFCREVYSIYVRADGPVLTKLLAGNDITVKGHNIATAGGSTSLTLPAAYRDDDVDYTGCYLYITTGTGIGTLALITAFNNSTGACTTDTGTFGATSVFKLLDAIDVLSTMGLSSRALLAGDYITCPGHPFIFMRANIGSGSLIIYPKTIY